MPLLALVRLTSVCAVCVLAIFSSGAKAFEFLFQTLTISHGVIGFYFARKRLRAGGAIPILLCTGATLLLWFVAAKNQAYSTAIFVVHSLFMDIYLFENRYGHLAAEREVRFLRMGLNALFYFFLIRQDFVWNETFALLLIGFAAGIGIAMYRALRNCPGVFRREVLCFELTGAIACCLGFCFATTSSHLILYHVFVSMFLPFESGLKAGAQVIAGHVLIFLPLAALFVGLSRGDRQLIFMTATLIHIVFSFAFSRANPLFLRRFVYGMTSFTLKVPS